MRLDDDLPFYRIRDLLLQRFVLQDFCCRFGDLYYRQQMQRRFMPGQLFRGKSKVTFSFSHLLAVQIPVKSGSRIVTEGVEGLTFPLCEFNGFFTGRKIRNTAG
jgi:hypothetical protein